MLQAISPIPARHPFQAPQGPSRPLLRCRALAAVRFQRHSLLMLLHWALEVSHGLISEGWSVRETITRRTTWNSDPKRIALLLELKLAMFQCLEKRSCYRTSRLVRKGRKQLS